MNTFFTADLHISHANIIKYCSRTKFMNAKELDLLHSIDEGLIPQEDLKISRETVEKMNCHLVDQINTKVKVNDVLWALGDIFLCRDFTEAQRWRNRIICKDIRLIWGNHDPDWTKSLFTSYQDQALLKIDRQHIFVNHYPMRSWERAHHGSWMLYGHVHQLYAEADRQGNSLTLDVGVDGHDYAPWSMDEINEYMKPKKAAFEESLAQQGFGST